MRKRKTAGYSLLASLLLAILLVVALGGSMAAQAGQTDPSGPAAPVVDINNSDKPALQTGGPSGPVVYSDQQDATGADRPQAPDVPAITVWDGLNQTFGGTRGNPQKWINIRGNVASANPLTTLQYTLNGGPAQSLDTGPDDRRLAQTGDFNIELDYTDLTVGANTVVITAISSAGQDQETVTVNYQNASAFPPGDYTYNWAGATKINDIAHIVDGNWIINGGVIEPTWLDFDRLVALGDLSWKDYTVEVPITINAIDDTGFGAPSNGPGIGVMVRWLGHYDAGNGFQPVTGWRRLGAMGWYRWTKDQGVTVSGFQLLNDNGNVAVENSRQIDFGKTYIYKLQVESVSGPNSPATYRFKVWEATDPEPAAWDMTFVGKATEPRSGSIMLVAHHVDASFGTVEVTLNSTASAPKLQVATGGSGSGTVAKGPDKQTYKFGEDVTLTAVPGSGSTFNGWAGDLSGTANPQTITLFEDASVTALFTDPNAVSPASDDFSGCVLDETVWTFVDPLGGSNVLLNGEQAEISVPGGDARDIWNDGPNAPRLMQFTNDDDFEIDVKFDSTLSQKTQLLGVYVEEDDKKHIKFNIQHDGNGYKVAAYTFVNGSNQPAHVNQSINVSAPFWLRVNRTGDSWTFSYSNNGTTFTQAAAFDFAMTVNAVGPFVGNAGKNAPAVVGQIDYFFNTSDPIVPEDGSRKLTVDTIGSGSVDVEPQKENYACGETVALTAVPAPGFRFDSWGGALSGSNPIETLVMNKAESVTATFVSDTQFTVTVEQTPHGTIVRDPDLPSYPGGSTVELEAVADLGYQFSAWGGDAAGFGNANPISLTVDSNKTVSGTFTLAPNRTLTVNATNGSVDINPDKPSYLNNEPVTLTATPDAGYGFAGWSGDLTGNENPVTFKIDANKTINANFALNQFTVVTQVSQGTGSVSVEPQQLLYFDGQKVTLTATPGPGFIFSGWGGDATGSTNPIEVTVTKNTLVTASFVTTGSFELMTPVVGTGDVTRNPDKANYGFGEVVELTPIAGPDYAFVGWSGDLNGIDNPGLITITKDSTVTATFGLDNQYALTLTAAGQGSVVPNPNRPLYADGQQVLLTAVPQPGYRFIEWSGDLVGTTNPITIQMTRDTAITATFAEAVPVTLTTSALPADGGSVAVDPVKTEYQTGDVITLTASAAPGYTFAGWSGDASGNTNPLEGYVLDGDKNIVANFTTSAAPDSEDFNTCLLDPRWTFVDPNGLASYALSGTQAIITVPPGQDYNLWDQGNNSARLIQPAANTDFQLEAKFETTPAQQYQMQGILVQESVDDFMRFDFFHDGTELRVFAATVEGTFATKKKSEAIAPGDDLYLRVRRQGDTWRVWYAYDGQNWTTIGSFKHEIRVSAAGVFASSYFRNNDQAPGFTAVIDYFFDVESPIVPEDVAPPGINITIAGQGTIQRSPAQDNYFCGDRVTLTPQPSPGWVFGQWSGDLQSTIPVQNVVVNDEINLVATFLQQGAQSFKAYLPMSVDR